MGPISSFRIREGWGDTAHFFLVAQPLVASHDYILYRDFDECNIFFCWNRWCWAHDRQSIIVACMEVL